MQEEYITGYHLLECDCGHFAATGQLFVHGLTVGLSNRAQANHLSGLKNLYMKISFNNVQVGGLPLRLVSVIAHSMIYLRVPRCFRSS